MWTKETIIARTKSALKFWVPFVGVCAIIILLILGLMAEQRQSDIQVETLIEARLVGQNQEILKELKSVLNDISKNQAILIENRRLWDTHFISLRTSFANEIEGHRKEVEKLREEIVSLKSEITVLKDDILKKQEELNQSQKNVESLVESLRQRGR